MKPQSLARIVEYLIRDLPEVESVSYVRERSRLVRLAERTLPHVIIVNGDSLKAKTGSMVEALRNASPGSKLIATLYGADVQVKDCDADACIDEASLTSQLIPTLRRLSAGSGQEVSRRTKQGRSQ